MHWFQEDNNYSYTQKTVQQAIPARAHTRKFISQFVTREMATV